MRNNYHFVLFRPAFEIPVPEDIQAHPTMDAAELKTETRKRYALN